jgi:hypothetical protein
METDGLGDRVRFLCRRPNVADIIAVTNVFAIRSHSTANFDAVNEV